MLFLRNIFPDASREDTNKFIFDGTSFFSVGEGLPLKAVVLEDKRKSYNVSCVSHVNITLQDSGDNVAQLSQVLNVILKRAIGTELQQIGRNSYDKNKPVALQGDIANLIIVLPGYQTEIAYKMFQGKSRLVVGVDTMSKVISKKTALGVIQNEVGRGNSTEITNSQHKAAIKMKLVGTTVFTSYNNNAYVVESVDFAQNPLSTFTYRRRGAGKDAEEVQISYAQYVLDNHKVKINDVKQPLLRSSGRNKQKVFLVPELCLITDIEQKAKEKLPQICSVKPQDRVPRIKDLPTLLQNDKAKRIMEIFRMKVDSNLIEVKATTVPQPWLQMPGVQDFAPQKSWGPETGRDLKYTLKGDPRLVTCYAIFDPQGADLAKDYAIAISKDMEAKNAPMRIQVVPVQMDQNQDPIAALTQKVPQPKMPCMLLCILGDTKNKLYYGTVKEFSNKQGIISQCINLSKQRSKGEQKGTICGNIMKQILNKYGFLCWRANVARIAPSLKGRILMLIGVDVYHAKMRFVEKQDIYFQRRSVGAFVAIFINVNTGDYLTSNNVVEVKAKVELLCKAESDSDTSSVKSDGSSKNAAVEKQFEAPEITRADTLQKFVERALAEHKVTPDQIIVYRDGVGDSMLDAVSKTEVKQVQNACKSAKLIYAVAQKRIHTRFFVDAPGRGLGNPAAGTVLQEAVSSPNEFYLIPTKCTLSTVRPVRYILLWNDNAMPLNEFQSLTYGLCHVYPNWPDSITLPFPTQLAHKLAFLLGESVQSININPSLFKNYFYL